MTILKQALLAALFASALVGCGVRGNPEPPPSFTQN
jgi:predicted small lipoprotein YifL